MSALSCERCGASLRAEDGATLLHCSYCGTEAKLAPEVLADARDYRKAVSERLAQAAEQAGFARAYTAVSAGQFSAPAPVAVVTPLVNGVCSACGAVSQFRAGAMLSRCSYCGASLLASSSTQRRGLDAAAREARASRLEALKAERYFALGLARKYSRLATYNELALVILPGVAAIVSWLFGVTRDPRQPLWFASVGVLALIVLGIVRRWKRSWQARATSAVIAVGSPLPDLAATVAWLNAHWAHEYDVYDLSSAGRSAAAACDVHGYAALVLVNPLSRQGLPFVDLLLSAWYDSRSERGEGPVVKGDGVARGDLEALGFDLRSGPSGIHARLRGEASRRALKQGIDLPGALVTLARLARSQGAVPADA